MYACMHVCMYVCMYVYIYIYIHVYIAYTYTYISPLEKRTLGDPLCPATRQPKRPRPGVEAPRFSAI